MNILQKLKGFASQITFQLVIGSAFFLTLPSAYGGCSAKSSFFVAEDEVVYDKKTDLTWMRCSAGQVWKKNQGCIGFARFFSRDEAKFATKPFAIKNSKGISTTGWRLPSSQEFISIIDKFCNVDSNGTLPFLQEQKAGIDATFFPDTPVGFFYTEDLSVPYASCRIIDSINGGTKDNCVPQGRHHIRLVKSGK